MFRTFEEIDAWKGARELASSSKALLRRARDEKDFGWVDQLSKALISIMANIAEGNDAKTNAEFLVFLGYAKRSAAEVRSHFYFGLDMGYMDQKEFEELSARAKKIGAQLAKLMSYLHSAPSSSMRMATMKVTSKQANQQTS